MGVCLAKGMISNSSTSLPNVPFPFPRSPIPLITSHAHTLRNFDSSMYRS